MRLNALCLMVSKFSDMLIHTPQRKEKVCSSTDLLDKLYSLFTCIRHIPYEYLLQCCTTCVWPLHILSCCTSNALHWQPGTARIKFKTMPMALPNATSNPSSNSTPEPGKCTGYSGSIRNSFPFVRAHDGPVHL